MITLEQYVGMWKDSTDWTIERTANAVQLLAKCALLESIARADGVEFPDNQKTGTGISGERFGGFRPQACKEGAPDSAHKQGRAVDRYDPEGKIDFWCMRNAEVGGTLEQCGIYIEHPSATMGWSHWTDRPPPSKRRVFYP